MEKKSFINYDASIKEMHDRLNIVNESFFLKYGNAFDAANKALLDAIRAGDEHATDIILDFLVKISYSREIANFGNPNMHIMQPLLAKIFERLEKVTDIPVPPYGIIDSKKINAVFRRKKTDPNIMMLGFSSDLFTYAQLMCKVISATFLISDSPNSFVIKPNYADSMTQNIIDRYVEIVFNATAPLLSMGTVRPLKYPKSLTNVSYQLCDVFEVFVAAHEHAHVYLEFALDRNEQLKDFVANKPRWIHETFADYLGTINCLKIMESEGLPQELIVLGITIAMNSLSILDLYDYILFDEKLNDNYVQFPHRIMSFDLIPLNNDSKIVIQSVNNLFIDLWNNSIDALMELKKQYDKVDTIEDFVNSNIYQKTINSLENEEKLVDILDILKSAIQQHPELFPESLNQFLMRNIVRFKVGKCDEASKGFEEYIRCINKLANNPDDFWFQQTIAMLYLSIICEKENKQEKAFSLLRDVQLKIMDPLKSKGITLEEDYPEIRSNSYSSLLTLTFFGLLVLAEGDEEKMKLVIHFF